MCDPGLVRLLPGVAGACQALRRAGCTLVVVSNQGVVARGGASIEGVHAVNARVEELLARGAGTAEGERVIEAFYFCPYHPAGTVPGYAREHPWRKPAPGMILAAAADLRLSLGGSWLVGDAPRDVEAGLAAGLAAERCLRIGPGAPLADLAAAAAVILGHRASP